MAVSDTLDKITARHPDVIGAMVLHAGKVQHNLEAPYDILSIETILETFSEVFEQTGILADEGYDFGELILDFANHSFIVRAIEDGLLAVVAPRMQRGQLVKLHVGLGIFGKAVQKALAEDCAAPDIAEVTAEPEAADASAELLCEAEDAASGAPEDASHDESALGMMLGLGKKRKTGFRGTKELLASRVAAAEEAVGEPMPKEPEVTPDGVPLRPDGTPMKKRVYRGSVFWE